MSCESLPTLIYVYIDLGEVFLTYISELFNYYLFNYFLRSLDIHHAYDMQGYLTIFLSSLDLLMKIGIIIYW